MTWFWQAEAEYEDGTIIRRLFDRDESISSDEDQYRIERWLIEREKVCTFYSVVLVNEGR